MKKQIESIKTDFLLFDPNNPRLPASVDGKNEEQVIEWMLENENVLELMASIGEKGYFAAEPLLIIESKNKTGYFEVIEGNRRLTAIKLLREPHKATSRKISIQEIVDQAKAISTLDKIPIVKFDDYDELQLYLGYKHITGVQPWDALAKAKYLKRLKENLKKEKSDHSYEALAKLIGSRADHVKLLLAGLAIYEIIEDKAFFKIKDLNEKTIKFGVLYTALNHSNIANFIGLNIDSKNPVAKIEQTKLKELSEWMYEKIGESKRTKLGESRNLRLLNKVLSPENQKALEAFRNDKSLNDSVLLTELPNEIFETSLDQALEKLQVARDYMHLIREADTKYEGTLTEIRQMSKIILDVVRAKLVNDDED